MENDNLQKLEQENSQLREELQQANSRIEKMINFPKHNRLPVFSFSRDGELNWENDAKIALLPSIRRLTDIWPDMTLDEMELVIEQERSIDAMVTDGGRHYQLLIKGAPKYGKVLVYGFDNTATVELNRQLEEKAHIAEQANRAKDQFLASMSHELRTPLASILGNSELLMGECNSPEEQEIIQSILSAGHHQLALVNDILDVLQIDSGKLVIEEQSFDLNALLGELERIFSCRATEAGLHLSIKSELPHHQFIGDEERIRQVLFNLIGNGIKFTEKGEVVCRVVQIEDHLRFEITDSGIGIAQDQLERLFDRFEQADRSNTRRFGGSGLGLYISNRLSELMGGKIEVNSVPNEGSTFSLHLPLKQSETEVSTANSDYRVDGYRGQVLVVEDNRALQMLEKRILENLGLSVILANNGQEAVDLVGTDRFDLILMDMQMPVMDGVSATKALRMSGNNTPVVAVTANVMQKHREQFSEAGCNGFLEKPIEKEKLHGVLQRYLG